MHSFRSMVSRRRLGDRHNRAVAFALPLFESRGLLAEEVVASIWTCFVSLSADTASAADTSGSGDLQERRSKREVHLFA
jgi:hypothetical protein